MRYSIYLFDTHCSRKFFLSFVIAFFLTEFAKASFFDDFQKTIVPNSPQAAEFMKYGEYPVSMATGVPQIEIPLYTISCDGVEVPISISYHASGIKVDDVASIVGLGWSLNAGGVISRTIMGGADGTSKWHNNRKRFYYSSAKDVQDCINRVRKDNSNGFVKAEMMCDTLSGMCGNDNYDSQSDKYYYRFGQYSGTFRYDVGRDTIVMLPYQTFSIKESSKGYEIIDNNGVKYCFYKDERSVMTTDRICSMEGSSRQHSISYDAITAWYLSYIVTTKGDTIKFDYYYGSNSGTITTVTQQLHHGEWWKSANSWYQQNYYSDLAWSGNNECTDNIVHNRIFSTPVIKTISWKGNQIEFSYDNKRPECESKLSNVLPKMRLANIVVKDADSKEVKRIEFENGSLGKGDYDRRMLLNKVTISGTETYTFEYNTKYSLPSYSSNQYKEGLLHCRYDYWGYYNGTDNFDRFIPKKALPSNYARDGANREPDYDYAQAGILKAIVYPTKGRTEFIYEGNANGPGLRIKSIVNKDGTNIVRKEEYSYSGTEMPSCDDYSYRTYFVFQTMMHKGNNPFVEFSSASSCTSCIDSEPLSSRNKLWGATCFYHYVTKTVRDGNNVIIASSDYEYDSDHHFEFHDAELDQYDSDFDPRLVSEEKNYDYGTVNPILTRQVDYGYENGKKKIMRETRNTYETVRTNLKPIVGVSINKDFTTCVWEPARVPHSWHPFYTPSEFVDRLCVANVYGLPNFKRLKSMVVKEYGIETTTSYTYDNGFRTLQPLSVTVKNGVGDSKKTVYSYPYQWKNDTVLVKMYKDNYVDVVVGTEEYVNNKIVSKSKDVYTAPGNGIYQLSERQFALGSNPLETRFKVLAYDKNGNFQHVVQDNNYIVLVWNDQNQVVAQIDCGNNSKWFESNKSIIESIEKKATVFTSGPYFRITNYKYKPLVGLCEVISGEGIKTSYVYDKMNRLSSIQDADNAVIEEYIYNYKH